jgi:N-acetylmuramoyl-L-alanine amidase
MFTSMGYEGLRKSRAAISDSNNKSITIIIDAGHGGEDPGAVANGIVEKDINLEIALSLSEMLSAFGYKTVLTRNDDTLLYKAGQENKKKYYDVRNREEIANSYENAVFVSIHMNKFPQENCKGLQTFYSENNPESKELANLIQSNAKLLQTNNTRQIKSGNSTIYLMKNLFMPSVLVECGFISNPSEAQLLADDKYKESLAFSLSCSISEFLEIKNEN